MTKDYLNKFKGTLMGVAIGDTLGGPFEGILREDIYSKFDDFEDFIWNNKKLFKTYTDDTQLTLHLAEALIQGNGFNTNSVIKHFVNWLEDPPIKPGYGCITSIKKLKYGISWKKASSNSGGNGTIMRIAPIGLFHSKNIEILKKTAKLSSLLTHSHPAASLGAIIIARAISYLVELEIKEKIIVEDFFSELINSISHIREDIQDEFIQNIEKLKTNLNLSIEAGLIKFSQIGVKSPYFIEEYLGKAFVHPYSMSTVICTLFIFLNNLDSFKECIYALVTSGGDTDTVGAIGGSLAGAYFGFDKIPEEMISLVKNRKYILNVSERLYNVYIKQFNRLI